MPHTWRGRTTWPPCRPTAFTASFDSDHEGLVAQEKGSAATTQAIVDVVSSVRTLAAIDSP
jgi:hypothetical protein